MGEDRKKTAEEKFQAISRAYEGILLYFRNNRM